MVFKIEHTIADIDRIKTAIGEVLHVGAGPVWLRVSVPLVTSLCIACTEDA